MNIHDPMNPQVTNLAQTPWLKRALAFFLMPLAVLGIILMTANLGPLLKAILQVNGAIITSDWYALEGQDE